MNQRGAVGTIVDRIPAEPQSSGRFVVAVAGPPGSGKSTIAAQLVDALGGRAGLLGMDAFHFDNTILEARGHRARKGAPHTFDVASYAVWLEVLKHDRSRAFAVPVYDRALSVSRNCTQLVEPAHDVLVTEGNYLLLDDDPWPQLRPLFDLTVSLDVDLDIIEERIRDRWITAGLPDDEIERRTLDNDLPNARLVRERSAEADLVLPTTMRG